MRAGAMVDGFQAGFQPKVKSGGVTSVDKQTAIELAKDAARRCNGSLMAIVDEETGEVMWRFGEAPR